jgi:peptidyl-prolyl cis-trans isomerase-like 4
MSVLIETSLGDITIDLYTKECPEASKNFLKLSKRKYYHFSRVENVQKDFLFRVSHPFKIPVSMNLLEGKSKHFKDCIPKDQRIKQKGLIGTANRGPDQNDSDFFVTLTDNRLDTIEGKHTIFGEIVDGLEVLDKINQCLLDNTNKPLMHISIFHTYVIDDPFPDPEEFVEPASPEPEQYLQNISDGEDFKNMKEELEEDINAEELEKNIKRHQTKTKEVVLEMLNDIPDADMKPGENILFVCKLNPLTQEQDLETIFSQFGKIKSCEIIKDWKTLDSLQYAFIEFETKEGAEEAYFKMHNALVDDRRIHVDFSQSIINRQAKNNYVRHRKQKFYEEVREKKIKKETENETEFKSKKIKKDKSKKKHKKKKHKKY